MSILAEYHNDITRRLHIQDGQADFDDSVATMYDQAADTAIDLIVFAGFDASDSDLCGNEMGDQVQTLLTLAMTLCPEMGEKLHNLLNNG